MKVVSFILDIVRKYPKQFAFVIFILLILNFIEMGAVLSLAPLVDLITKPDLNGASSITFRLLGALRFLNLPANIYSIMLLVFGFALLRGMMSIAVFNAVLRIKYAMIRDLIHDTYESFFNAKWNFFITHSQGMLGNTFVKEISKVGDSFGHMGMMFVRLFQITVYFGIAIFISWKLSLIIVALSIIFAFPFSLLGRLTYRYGKINLETANRMFEIIQENLAAAKLIIGFGEPKKGALVLERAVQAHVNATLKSQIVEVGTPMAFQPVVMGILLSSILISKTFIKVSLSELTVILFSFYSALPLIGQLVGYKNSLLNFFPSYEQLTDLRLIAAKGKQLSGDHLFNKLNERIVLQGVNFRYPENDFLLNDVNIDIPRGKMVAFIGKSGSGKSTLVDLLLRFYDPDSGCIQIDGRDLKNMDVLSWRRKIGYVPQDSVLFNTTIRDNLKWAKDDATEQELKSACEMANVNEFLLDMPKGLDTNVGDRGVRLSGGQKQRIALARAILRQPELLILDEATSSLDSQSEKLIQEAIEAIAGKRTTVVVVAHRLSTIVNADHIYVIDEGRVIEAGDFTILCAKKGKGYELARMQGLA